MVEGHSAINDTPVQPVRRVIERLIRDGTAVSPVDGTTHQIFPVAVSSEEGEALRRWVVQEGAAQTIEIGLGYGISALYICDGLLTHGHADARHTVIDPFQASRFANCGLQALAEAGVDRLVEHHAEKSHFVLPQLLRDERRFDLAFVDGNHRFDAVFLDLYYLGMLVRPGGIVALDDYDMPAIQRAVSFFVKNLNWKLEETSHHLAVLRTASEPDDRHFTHFVEF